MDIVALLLVFTAWCSLIRLNSRQRSGLPLYEFYIYELTICFLFIFNYKNKLMCYFYDIYSIHWFIGKITTYLTIKKNLLQSKILQQSSISVIIFQLTTPKEAKELRFVLVNNSHRIVILVLRHLSLFGEHFESSPNPPFGGCWFTFVIYAAETAVSVFTLVMYYVK